MQPTAVEFNLDERALLDYLNKRMDADGTVSVSDSQILRDLHLIDAPQRFFSASRRLVAAHLIELHVDGRGNQLIRVLAPERPAVLSKRYVFTIIPLECLGPVLALVKDFRDAARTAPSPAKKSYDHSRAQGMAKPRLGIRETAALPDRAVLRPPLRQK